MVSFPSIQIVLSIHVAAFPGVHTGFRSEILDKYHPAGGIYYTFSSCSLISSLETALPAKVTF